VNKQITEEVVLNCVICLKEVRLDEWLIPMVNIRRTLKHGDKVEWVNEKHGYAHVYHFQNTEWDDDDD